MIKAKLQGKITSVRVDNLTIDGMESVVITSQITGTLEQQAKPATPYIGRNVSYVWKPMLDNGKANYGYSIVFGLLSLEQKRHLRERIAELKSEGISLTNAELLRAWAATDVLEGMLKDREVEIEHKSNLLNGKIYEDYEPRFKDKDVTEADAIAMIIASRRAPKTAAAVDDIEI